MFSHIHEIYWNKELHLLNMHHHRYNNNNFLLSLPFYEKKVHNTDDTKICKFIVNISSYKIF